MTEIIELTGRDIKTVILNMRNIRKDLKKKHIHNKKRNRRYKKTITFRNIKYEI